MHLATGFEAPCGIADPTEKKPHKDNKNNK
jgi:hypothetical protein